jgi:hypothetical protein
LVCRAVRTALEIRESVAVVLQFIVDHAQRMDVDEEREIPGRPPRLLHDLPDAIDQLLVTTRFKGKTDPLALSTLAHRLSVLSTWRELVPELENVTLARTANPLTA